MNRMTLRLPLLLCLGAASGCASGIGSAQSVSGAELFFTHCASCHGRQGEGDGPVAAVMSVAVPNLRTLSQRSNGTFPAEAVSAYVDGRDLPRAHGERIMPVWGDVFADDGGAVDDAPRRLAAVVEFVRELQYAP